MAIFTGNMHSFCTAYPLGAHLLCSAFAAAFFLPQVANAQSAANARLEKKYPDTVYVADFGATPDDGLDDTEAVNKAVATAKPGTRIVFGNGVYDFKKMTKAIAAIIVEKKEDIALDGRGATLTAHAEGAYIAIAGSQNIGIYGLKIKQAAPTHALAKIDKIDKAAATFDCSLFEPSVAEQRYVKAITSFDPIKRIFTPDSDIYQTKFRKFAEPIDSWTLRVPLANPAVSLDEGATVVLRYQVYAPPAIIAANSRNITLSDIAIASHAGMGVFACNCENIHAEKIAIAPDSESEMISTTADGIHLANCRGKIRIENSVFDKCGDDCINIHQNYWVVAEITGANSMKLRLGKKLGGLVKVFQPRKFDILEIGSAENWVRPAYFGEVVESVADAKSAEVYITLQDPLPSWITPNMPVTNASALPKVDIEKCSFGSNRGRGIILLTDGAEVEHCTFENTALPAVYMKCDYAKWSEGPVPRNIKIADCKFKNCNHWKLEDGAPAIFASAKIPDGMPADGWLSENIKIENCTFENCSDTPVRLENMRDTADTASVNEDAGTPNGSPAPEPAANADGKKSPNAQAAQ